MPFQLAVRVAVQKFQKFVRDSKNKNEIGRVRLRQSSVCAYDERENRERRVYRGPYTTTREWFIRSERRNGGFACSVRYWSVAKTFTDGTAVSRFCPYSGRRRRLLRRRYGFIIFRREQKNVGGGGGKENSVCRRDCRSRKTSGNHFGGEKKISATRLIVFTGRE